MPVKVVAAAELGLMAGADRVEGTLFGNGERTGNVDLVTLALNLYRDGVDPGLDFSEIDEVVRTVEYCNQMPVSDRQPYSGKLVYTAFSGSHQDAIKKALAKREQEHEVRWEVPYLPIDPLDLGRTYEAIIRVNSQSGKGGIAYLLEKEQGLKLPRAFQVVLSQAVQAVADATGRELSVGEIFEVFRKAYVLHHDPIHLKSYMDREVDGVYELTVELESREGLEVFSAFGKGPIDALVRVIEQRFSKRLDIREYEEHALEAGSGARAVAYLQAECEGELVYGVGMNTNVTLASMLALVSILNQLLL